MALGLNTSGIQVGAAAIAADLTRMRLHTADPSTSAGTTFATTAGEKTITCTAAAGVITIPATSFTGGAASGACTHVSLWSGTTYRAAYKLVGDQTFNAAGEYNVTGGTITGTAS